MYKYFERLSDVMLPVEISEEEIVLYRNKVLSQMKLMGASKNEMALVQDAAIRNAIRNNRKPEDVAWAILQ